MGTDDPIARLAADPRARPRLGRALTLAPLAGLVLTGLPALAALGGQTRPRGGARGPPHGVKRALPLAVAGLALALRRSRPEAWLGARALASPPVLLLAAGLVATALAALPVAAWGPTIHGSTRLTCLASVLGMDLGPLAAAHWALGRGATTAPRLSGLLAGLGAGGLAAALYAVHRDEDAAPFCVTWYGAGILSVGARGALLGLRALRW